MDRGGVMISREFQRFNKAADRLERTLAKEVARLESGRPSFLSRIPTWLIVLLTILLLVALLAVSLLPFLYMNKPTC